MEISALKFISLSEIAKVIPDITYEWVDQNKPKFMQMLHELGCNVQNENSIEVQEDLLHRNFFGEIVQCTRWVCNERTDDEWVKSGYASQAAIDKSKNSALLIDLYRLKGQVE